VAGLELSPPEEVRVMTDNPHIASAAAWMTAQMDAIAYGEICVRLVVHDGRIRRVERELVDKLEARKQ